MPPTKPTTAVPVINNIWGSQPAEGETELITLPSGQVARAMRIGLQTLVAEGLLGETDSLSSYVGEQHIRRVRNNKGKLVNKEEISASSIASDPEALKRVLLLVDRALPHIVVEPRVLSHVEDLPDGGTKRIDSADRVAGAVYTDQVGLEDKMFLFQFAMGGVRDLERFREESDNAVADIHPRKNVARPTKRTPAARPRKARG